MKRRDSFRTGNSILRLLFVGLSLFLQVGWFLLLGLELNRYSTAISLGINMLTLIVVLRLHSKRITSAMKMPWIIVILSFPVLGLCLFILIVLCSDLGSMKKQLRRSKEITHNLLNKSGADLTQLEKEDLAVANLFRYLHRYGQCPVYRNTKAVYFSKASDAFEELKIAIEQAEHYIFMEYFIIADGSAFRELREILVRKAREGVDVRLMYDDIGSIGYVNLRFAKKLNEEGIRCKVFNPAIPILNLFMNHRDHRKITVVDGKVGFTGGFNLADEYFGRAFPYGKWKDTGLRLEGDAVRSLTASFLEMWNATSREEEDYSKYVNAAPIDADTKGYIQPFLDDPLEEERVAENVYMNLAAAAQKSLYIMTPYLIISDEMQNALGLAAKRGVDVRIITPGIPDKRTVYAVTRSYYSALIAEGVRIFEYTPGFCHAKECICDGKVASIGTSNLDYRSLYHHFENDVLLYGTDSVKSIAEDFEECFQVSREVTENYRKGRGALLLLWQCILRLFAPLM